MTDRLEALWNRLERVKKTKGLKHPEFYRAFREFSLERRRQQAAKRRAESRGSAANGFRPQRSQRDAFGAKNHKPDPDDV